MITFIYVLKVQSPACTLNGRILGITLEYPNNKISIDKIVLRSKVLSKV